MSDQSHSNRNLLLALLAFQLDFIGRDAFLDAVRNWVDNKSRSMAEILSHTGLLTGDRLKLVESLVEEHVRLHDDDSQRSLGALSSIASVRAELKAIGDVDVNASLGLTASIHGMADDETLPVILQQASAEARDRFRIVRLHAQGGLGDVFVAHDQEIDRVVAVKQIRSDREGDPENHKRFRYEAEVTGGLEHPGIVPVYGLGVDGDGRPYYAMRFIRGDSLRDAIERFHQDGRFVKRGGGRVLELRKLLGRFIDVCEAIQYAHSRGVLHRDLKPGNVMLGKYGETLVVDWGLAKTVGRDRTGSDGGETTIRPSTETDPASTQDGKAIGTPAYMSPEQAAGRLEEIGPASDVYNLGATLYHLLTGAPPNRGDDVLDILKNVERGEIPSPRQVNRHVPPALEAVCLKALALKPSDRFTSPRKLADDVERWLADEPARAYDEPLGHRAARWLRRHRTFATASAVAFVLLCLSAVVGTILWQRARRIDYQRVVDLQASAESSERLAGEALQAGRFEAAFKNLDEAVRNLSADDRSQHEQSLKDLPDRLQLRRDRVGRLMQFDQWGRKGEELTFFDSTTDAIVYLQESLLALEVFKHPDWWAHLPDDDLTAEQKDELCGDIYRRLLILSGLRAKSQMSDPAFINNPPNPQGANGQPANAQVADPPELFEPNPAPALDRLAIQKQLLPLIFGPNPPAADSPEDKAIRSALATGRLADGYQPSSAFAFCEEFRAIRQGKSDLLLSFPDPSPTNAPDNYVVGAVLFDAKKRFPVAMPFFQTLLGIDAMASQTMLQTACRLEPRSYWGHIVLARDQMEMNKFDAAEQACGRCISIRPDYWLGYIERARVSLARHQSPPVPDLLGFLKRRRVARRRPDDNVPNIDSWGRLLQQGWNDIERAHELQPLPAEVYWYRGKLLGAVDGQRSRVVQAYLRAIELEQPGQELNDPFLQGIRRERLKETRDYAHEGTNDADSLALLALSELALANAGNPVDPAAERAGISLNNALNAAEKVLELLHNDARALAVRGWVSFKREEFEKARADFVEAQKQVNHGASSTFGLAMTYERLHQHEDALSGYERVCNMPVPDWQCAAARLGSCRALLHLQRVDEAEKALDNALEVNRAADVDSVLVLARKMNATALVQRLEDRQRDLEPIQLDDGFWNSARVVALLNGDFELGLTRYWGSSSKHQGKPVWFNRGGCQSSAAVTDDECHGGRMSLHATNKSPKQSGVEGGTSQPIRLAHGVQYRMSLWAKANRLSENGMSIAIAGDPQLEVPRITLAPGTYDWTEFVCDFKLRSTPAAADIEESVDVDILFKDTGEVWLDDLRIERVEGPP